MTRFDVPATFMGANAADVGGAPAAPAASAPGPAPSTGRTADTRGAASAGARTSGPTDRAGTPGADAPLGGVSATDGRSVRAADGGAPAPTGDPRSSTAAAPAHRSDVADPIAARGSDDATARPTTTAGRARESHGGTGPISASGGDTSAARGATGGGAGARRAAGAGRGPNPLATVAAGASGTAEGGSAVGFAAEPATSAAPAASSAPAAPAAPATTVSAPEPVLGSGAARPVPEAPLAPGEVERLVGGWHHDPHGLLGAHDTVYGTAVRVLRPLAERVVVETGTASFELTHQQDGLFTGLLPKAGVTEGYLLRVTYAGTEYEQEDGYRFLPTLGEADLHLISEGRHEQLWRVLGSHPRLVEGVSGTAFAVWAPNASGVRVTGDFNGWNGASHPMRSLGASGVWELFVPGIGEGATYKYEIATRDSRMLQKADPLARRTECPPSTASIVTSSHHEWHDADWMATRGRLPHHQAPMSVYEIHPESWRPGMTYRQLAEELPGYVRDLGFTHVELMPVMEHPFGGSWGYQVSGYFAPTTRLGTPDDFRHLVDKLHQAGIGVIVDWVPAHFPKDDFALARFDGEPLYEPADPRRAEHPDWGTLEFDYGRAEVRNFLVANAVYWGEEFHVDGLRVDAVASMLYLDYSREHGEWAPNEHGGRENWDAVRFLQEMNATVYRRCPGIVTIAEESTAWTGVTAPTDHGGLGFGLKWNMGWMHDSLVYMSKEPVHRKYHHNEMTFSMVYAYSENYVLPISHDEVVHGKRALVSKMPGDWWQQRANHRAYLGFMWAHPGKQLLFMGSEFAQGAEWDHNEGPQWWVLDPAWPAHAEHEGVRDLVRDLNRLYLDTPALWQLDSDPAGFSWLDGGAADDNVFSFVRYDAQGRPLVCVSNMSPVVRHGFRVGLPTVRADVRDARWLEVLNTDTEVYGGSGVGNPDPVKAEPVEWNGRDTSAELTLPPLSTIWLSPA